MDALGSNDDIDEFRFVMPGSRSSDRMPNGDTRRKIRNIGLEH